VTVQNEIDVERYRIGIEAARCVGTRRERSRTLGFGHRDRIEAEPGFGKDELDVRGRSRPGEICEMLAAERHAAHART
jgi:hypothetical protein